MGRPRTIFFGTPEIAVPSLEALARLSDVALVVAQPDRPAGRGQKLEAPPVKRRALELGLRVLQPTKVRVPEFAAELRAVEADVALVIAYGRILTRAVLDAPRRGCVNVHASILPRWRGAAPIQWAVASGDRETGVCLMEMDEGLDTGPVFICDRTPIGPDETSGELAVRLGRMGADLVERALLPWLEGALPAAPQDPALATTARLLEKSDAVLDFHKPAQAVHDWARGMHPWPGAETRLGGERLKVHATRVARAEGALGEAGVVVAAGAEGLEVACGQGSVRLVEVQAEGKRRMRAAEWLAGRPVPPGTKLG